tara:strand:- start:9553 stop:10473 length:921 start_codon:yes stop_codon:yes gene_type:complete
MDENELDLTKVFNFLKKNIFKLISITVLILVTLIYLSERIKSLKYFDKASISMQVQPMIVKDENLFESVNISINELEVFTELIQKFIFRQSINFNNILERETLIKKEEKPIMMINKYKLYEMFLEYAYFPNELNVSKSDKELIEILRKLKIVRSRGDKEFPSFNLITKVSISNLDRDLIKLNKALKIINDRVFVDIQNDVNQKLKITETKVASLERAFAVDDQNDENINNLLNSNQRLLKFFISDISLSNLYKGSKLKAVQYDINNYTLKRNLIVESYFLFAIILSIILSIITSLMFNLIISYIRK